MNEKFSKLLTDVKSKYPRGWRVFRNIFSLKNFAIIFAAIFVFFAGKMAVNYVLMRQFGAEDAGKFILEKPELTTYSTLITVVLAFIFWAFFGSAVWGVGAFYSLLVIIMFINEEKMRSRNLPFLPEDLAMSSEAGSLMDMVNWGNFFLMVAQVAGIIFACAIIRHFTKNIPKHNLPKFAKFGFRIAMIIALLNILARETDFLRTKVAASGKTFVEVESLKTNIDFTDSGYNFLTNGYIVGTVSALQSNAIQQPKDYSKETISKIVKKYTALAEEQNSTKNPISKEKINVIFIMSESFIDPRDISSIYDFGETDPIPFTHKILAEHSSGKTSTAEYGGGTANVEFEALTGLSKKFINAIPYSTILNSEKNSPSIAKILKKNGYTTTAIHPYKATMYRRNAVYPNLGFDNFIDQTKMKNTTKIDNSQYISDEAAFNEVFETMKSTDSADFIHLVTMQGHMPYGGNFYNEKHFSVKNRYENTDSTTAEWENYLESIHRSDSAMKNLISKIEKSGEKTIIAFWGDHWPGIAGAIDGETTQHTPLFIYNNFGAEKNDFGKISLNQLQSQIFSLAGVQKTPFQTLISEVGKENQSLTKKIETKDSQALKDYELIQYDILSGKKYSLGDFYLSK